MAKEQYNADSITVLEDVYKRQTCMDILEHPEFLQKMKEEFEERKRKEQMQMA